jgi:hypothetical protein
VTPIVNIEIEGRYLRPLAIRDLTEKYLDGINDPSVNKYLVTAKSKK